VMDTIPGARFEFEGPIRERIQANIENWLLPAPAANPGMLDMFRARDRKPVPKLVPWAGEFVGKYLISTVQTLRLTKDARLRDQAKSIVAEFIGTQADDGYLGPFPKSDRLLKHWDLWGHYHALLALALWHEYSGDRAALTAARKAADLVCSTYLDTNRRVFDAGDHEMNMAILTGMAMMHRLTGESRYLRMAREVEKDWERAGDYVRTAAAGREFYQSPRPRWESLHDLQGLIELWRITGEKRYRDAFIHHWRSIRRWDRRNTGGFSSGEQATGNPFAPTAIETCCTVAWMALTLDYLRLTGDAAAADELEISTLNAGIGSQHPSGRWWTYSTPMDGAREASAHAIVFQARAGTPELNCCSVNGPRVLGMLGEWSLMSHPKGLVVNWLGAGRLSAPIADGSMVTITSTNDAWRDGLTTWRIEVPAEKTFEIRIRVPGWALDPVIEVNGDQIPGTLTGQYIAIRRTWRNHDRIEFKSRVATRTTAGARELTGKVSVYRGPLLLAFDSAHNEMDDGSIPAVALSDHLDMRVVTPSRPTPWLMVEVPSVDGRQLRLVDFASAGASGTRYRSWLAVQTPPPAPAFTQFPRDGARMRPGRLVFQWMSNHARDVIHRVEFSDRADFSNPIQKMEATGTRFELDSNKLVPAGIGRVYWRITSSDREGESTPDVPPAWFELDPNSPPQVVPPELKTGPNGELIVHTLREDQPTKYGKVESAEISGRTPQGANLNGVNDKVVYEVQWPDNDYTVSVDVSIKELPANRIGQIFSAWSQTMDDPLRIVVDGGKVFARIEAGGTVHSTTAVEIAPGQRYSVAATRRDNTLTLFLNGRPVGSIGGLPNHSTQTSACALGGNPRFAGNEYLAGRFSDFRFFARALSNGEIEEFAGHGTAQSPP